MGKTAWHHKDVSWRHGKKPHRTQAQKTYKLLGYGFPKSKSLTASVGLT